MSACPPAAFLSSQIYRGKAPKPHLHCPHKNVFTHGADSRFNNTQHKSRTASVSEVGSADIIC